MGNDRVVSAKEDQEEQVYQSLRPEIWGEFFGQRQVKEALMIAIEAAKKKKRGNGTYAFIWTTGIGENDFGSLDC
jgi:Holliday junction resolvasome RuvABC ATP-dependent DNA helicase subunit